MKLIRFATDRMSARVMLRLVLASLLLVWPILGDVTHVHAGPAIVHVAVLEPQVAGAGEGQNNALAMTLDHLLISHLAQREDVAMVDRQSLDAVLAERELALTGAVAGAVDNGKTVKAANDLKPFFAAGLLVVSEIDPKVRSVTVEVIVAQNGMRVGSLQWQLKKFDEASLTQMIQAQLPGLWDQVLDTLGEIAGKKTVEVMATVNHGRERLGWLADDAAQSAQAKVTLMHHVTLLTPRRPLVTKEERLLLVVGLAATDANDAAATLRVTPDVSVVLSVSEKDAIGKTFSKTPVTLHAQIRFRHDGHTLTKDFKGLAGDWDKTVDAMDKWLEESLAKIYKAADKNGSQDKSLNDDDEARVREMAANAMAGIEPWTKLRGGGIRYLPIHLQLRLCEVAMRASHLDPTNETAAWLVAITLLADQRDLYTSQQSPTYAGRVQLELQRYMDRFGKQNLDHYRDILERANGSVAYKYLKGSIMNRSQLLQPPDPSKYEPLRQYVHVKAEEGAMNLTLKYFGGSNVHVMFTHSLIAQLIPHIPQDQLEAEYAWWQHFYATRVDVLPVDKRPGRHGNMVAAPWELAQAAFAARRHEPGEVRRYLQIVARKYPQNIKDIWGREDDRHRPLTVPIFLKAAGDPEWETWQPMFGASDEVEVTLEDMTRMMHGARATVVPVWERDKMIPLQGIALVVPEQVRDALDAHSAKVKSSAEAVLQADDKIWLISPGSYSKFGVSEGLYVTTLPSKDHQPATLLSKAMIFPDLKEADPKPSFSCAHAVEDEKGTVFFMGTEKHGILRLEQVQGKWISRWLDTKNGLPTNNVLRMATCMRQGRVHLLVVSFDPVKLPGKSDYKAVTFAVDVRSDQSTLLVEDLNHSSGDVAVMKDGSRRLLTLSGSRAYAGPLILEEIVSFEKNVSLGWGTFESPWPFTIDNDHPGQVRLWKFQSDDRNRGSYLYDYDLKTLKPRRGTAPGRSIAKGISLAVNESVNHVIDPIMSWPGTDTTMRIHTWPSQEVWSAAGGGEILWLALKTDQTWIYPKMLVGYRPAPLGTRDWAADDQWIGPFYTPDHEQMTGLRSAQKPGQLLLSTQSHVMLLDENELANYARKHGASQSTRQWRARPSASADAR